MIEGEEGLPVVRYQGLHPVDSKVETVVQSGSYLVLEALGGTSCWFHVAWEG